MNDGTKSGLARSRRLIVSLLIVLVVALGLYLIVGGSVSESGPALVNERSSITIQSVSPKPAESEPEREVVKSFEGMSADGSSTFRDLLDKEYCYSRNGEAVMENPNDEMLEANIENQVAELQQETAWLAERLSKSDDGDHAFAAAMLGAWHGGRYELFGKANALDSDNRVYRFHNATECQRTGANCDTDTVLGEVVRVDADNSEAYLLRSMEHYRNQNFDLALSDLQMAAMMPRTESYFVDLVAIMERALAATGMGFSERSFMAFGLAASSGTSYATLSQMCTKMSVENLAWRASCIEYLERAEQQATTEIGHAIALGVLNSVVHDGDDANKRNAVAKRYAAYRERSKESVKRAMDEHYENDYYLFESPRLFNDYLNHMKAHGEYSAQQFLVEETARLKASGWLSPCELKRRTEAGAD